MNQSRPVVSAIITVYNEQQWIKAAVDSLIEQTLRDIEIVVVDDGSDDETASILATYDDPRLRIIRVERMGRAAALEYAVRQTRGEFVANLDADDECYPDRLERQVDFFRGHAEHGWLGGGEDREDSQRCEHYVRYYPFADRDIRRMSVKCIPYCHSAVMFRRALVEQGLNYRASQPFLIDFEFFIRVARRCQVANLSIPVVKRRAREQSFFQRSFSKADQNRELSRLCRVARREFDQPLWTEIYPTARSIYPYVPDVFKQGARRLLGLREVQTGERARPGTDEP